MAHIGGFEELVLLTVCALRDGAYAVPVQQSLESEGGRRSSMGSVYATLDRLEKKGLLTSHMGPASSRPGGKAKRFYQPTGTGLAALRSARNTRAKLAAGLSPDLSAKLGYSI